MPGKENHRTCPAARISNAGAQVGLLDDQAPPAPPAAQPATAKSSGRNCPSRFWNHQASISGMAIFRISLG